MSESQKAVLETLQEIATDIVSAISAGGFRASGFSSRMVEIKPKGESGGTLTMAGYVRFLFSGQGRKAGKFPPVDAIRDWVDSKNIAPVGNQSKDQQVFNIGRKIANRGTSIAEGRRGINLQKILRDNIQAANKTGGAINQAVRKDQIENINEFVVELNERNSSN